MALSWVAFACWFARCARCAWLRMTKGMGGFPVRFSLVVYLEGRNNVGGPPMARHYSNAFSKYYAHLILIREYLLPVTWISSITSPTAKTDPTLDVYCWKGIDSDATSPFMLIVERR